MIYASELDFSFYERCGCTIAAGINKLPALLGCSQGSAHKQAVDLDGRLMGWTNVDADDFENAAKNGPQAVNRLISRLTKISASNARFDTLADPVSGWVPYPTTPDFKG